MAKVNKLLLNGESGVGKTDLLKSLKDAYVIAIDGKDFPLKIPHSTYKENVSVTDIIEGYTTEVTEVTKEGIVAKEVEVEGIVTKLDKYAEHFGHYPTTIVIDSVSKWTNNAIDKGNADFQNFEVHSFIKGSIGLMNKFITEYLEPRCKNIILVNHVAVRDGEFVPTGTGNFKDKGGWYAEVDEAITVLAPSEKKRKVITRGKKYQARTLLDVPTEIPIAFIDKFDPKKSDEITDEHFNLQGYLDLMTEAKTDSEEWAI